MVALYKFDKSQPVNLLSIAGDEPPVLPQEKTKKACILLHFCFIVFFKEKKFLIIPLSLLQQPHGTDLLSLDQMEQGDFMLIRIRRHDNKYKETQVVISEVIIKIVFTISKTFYTGKERVFRILYGSTYLIVRCKKMNQQQTAHLNFL